MGETAFSLPTNDSDPNSGPPIRCKELGIDTTLQSHTRESSIQALADTGCQSCLAGTFILRQLGIKQSDLTKTSMKMRAANHDPISILGAIVLRLDLQGRTKQQSKLFTSLRRLTGVSSPWKLARNLASSHHRFPQ